MSRSSSNLHVFVHFKEETVFAGEDVECTIVFKNVATSRTASDRAIAGQAPLNGSARSAAVLEQLRLSKTSLRPGLGRTISASTQGTSRAISGNYAETPVTPGRETYLQSAQNGQRFSSSPTKERKHGRSVSIISLGSAKDGERPALRSNKTDSTPPRPAAHGQRFSQGSFQSIHEINESERDGNAGWQSPSRRSGTTISSRPYGPSAQAGEPTATPQRTSLAGMTTPGVSPTATRHPSPTMERQHRRAAGHRDGQTLNLEERPELAPLQVQRVRSPRISSDSRSPEAVDARVFSLRSNDGSPRPSMDLYNMSNRSDETLVSEFPAQSEARPTMRRPGSRQSSFFTINRPPITPKTETIMMCYVQVAGKFVLDGSLVNRAPFEEVKRRAVVGGQAGGGVVGITRSGADGGLFGALSWNSIGESLGGLLGSGQPSSMREMKDIAESESIPLLTTPKSILCIDLKLLPGQSKSFSYKFKMPRGLPPSHRGRAMKVSYDIMIATQRPGTANAISQVSVPFRLFGGVNSHGESLGHDLMSPYIILKERAVIQALDASTPQPPQHKEEDAFETAAQAEGFQSYVSQLLEAASRPEEGLLSPSIDINHPQTPRTPLTPRISSRGRSSSSPPPSAPSARALIDYAIRWAGLRHSAIYSPTTFNIARASVPIALLKISRSALRLGDLLACVLDFSNAKLPCFAIEATLESSERVDPSLAIRSAQSVERVTRRVWARNSDCTIGAGRCAWNFQVPVAGTPSFATTGVGVEWCIRVEIVVGVQPKQQAEPVADEPGPADHPDEEYDNHIADAQTETDNLAADVPVKSLPRISNTLLEVVEADERGALLAPKVRFQCESFEVVIPIRVFGAAVGAWGADSGAGAVTREATEEGLAV